MTKRNAMIYVAMYSLLTVLWLIGAVLETVDGHTLSAAIGYTFTAVSGVMMFCAGNEFSKF